MTSHLSLVVAASPCLSWSSSMVGSWDLKQHRVSPSLEHLKTFVSFQVLRLLSGVAWVHLKTCLWRQDSIPCVFFSMISHDAPEDKPAPTTIIVAQSCIHHHPSVPSLVPPLEPNLDELLEAGTMPEEKYPTRCPTGARQLAEVSRDPAAPALVELFAWGIGVWSGAWSWQRLPCY